MFGRKKKIKAEDEEWKRKFKERKINGNFKLKLTNKAEYVYKLNSDLRTSLYINGYTYDLIFSDVIYRLLKHEICMVCKPNCDGQFGNEIATDLLKDQTDIYPAHFLIRSNEDSQVVAFNPIKKDIIAQEVMFHCEGHGAASGLSFYALSRTPEEISRWPKSEINKLQELKNCKFQIIADEDWETIFFTINPQFITKQKLVDTINEVLDMYNMKLEI